MIHLALTIASALFLIWAACIAVMLAGHFVVFVLVLLMQIVLAPVEAVLTCWSHWRRRH